MIEIRWHGRGGQGVVTAANILGAAALHEGRYAQSFPFFGAERRGAPVSAFTRISDRAIRLRSQIYRPHWIILLDESLLQIANPLDGLREDGGLIVNTRRQAAELSHCGRVIALDATGIAQEVLGRPVTNTVMLGAVAALGLVGMPPLLKAIGEAFSGATAERNAKAAETAYALVAGE